MQTPEFQVFHWNSARYVIPTYVVSSYLFGTFLIFPLFLFFCLIHVLPLIAFCFTISAFTASFSVLCIWGRVCLFKISLFIVDKIYGVVE